MKMKKGIYALVSTLLIISVFSGCSQKRELDYKSVLDTDTGKIISLGDYKDYIERKLGDIYYIEDDEYGYAFGMIGVRYNSRDKAYNILIRLDSDRFVSQDINAYMKVEDLPSGFIFGEIQRDGQNYGFYARGRNEAGEIGESTDYVELVYVVGDKLAVYNITSNLLRDEDFS